MTDRKPLVSAADWQEAYPPTPPCDGTRDDCCSYAQDLPVDHGAAPTHTTEQTER